MTVLKGIIRKKGRKPTVDGYSSVASGYDETDPVFYINRQKYPVRLPSGRMLKGTSSADPIQNVSWVSQADGTVKITYDQQMRFDRKAVRGLFKIALESVAFFEGVGAASEAVVDPVRRFVLGGEGNFRAVMTPDQNVSYESYFHPGFQKEGFGRVVGMTLLGMGFLCDFDPEFKGGKMLLNEARKQNYSAQVIPNWPKRLWTENNPLNG